MRRALTIGTKRLEIFRRADRRSDDNPINFKDAAEARQYLLTLSRDPATMTTLRRVAANSPGLNPAGASDEQVLNWLADKLHRKEILLVDKGVVHGATAAAEEATAEAKEAPRPEPVKKKIFDLKLIKVSPHFAPGETIYIDGDTNNFSAGETCTIQYQVIDPNTTATRGTLEILRKKGGAVLHKIDLTTAQYGHGKHTIDWDGKCNAGPTTYPYVHLLHSPYTVRITVNGLSEKKVTGETAVLLQELSIQRGSYTLKGIAPAEGTNAHYQYQLTQMGFHLGAVDGDIGSKSERAIRNFQRSTGYLQVNGRLDDYTKAAIDHTAPGGTGTDHYQFILNYLGFRCGRCDGSTGAKMRRAIRRYKTVRAIAPINETLDATTKGRLDAEALAPISRRIVLEGDDAQTDVADNPFPAVGATKKVWVDGDSCWSPDGMPAGKWRRERDRLIRPSFPVIVRPLVKRKAGGKAHAPQGTGAVRVEFTVATTAPPADLGVPNTTARAFVQRVMTMDGGMNATGHHLHRSRGGVRTASDPGVFRAGTSLEPYDVSRSGTKHRCDCNLFWNERQGTAGVFFRLSTIGGDRFSLVAKVSKTGFDTPPGREVKKETGTFIVWRRYRLARRWLMAYVDRPHPIEAPKMRIPLFYEPCFVEFVDIDPSGPTMVVHQTPPNQLTRVGGAEIVDLELYRLILREAGYRPSQLSDAQITARYNAEKLYALTPAASWNNNWSTYRSAVSGEIDRYEKRFMRALRDLTGLEAPEGVLALIIGRNAPDPNSHQIPPGHNAPPGAKGWHWSVFAAHRTVILKQSADDYESTALAAQAGALAQEETLEFADSGEYTGVPLADRRITFAAGTSQEDVETAIMDNDIIGGHVSAGIVDGRLELEAQCLFQISSDKAAAANSTGIGTTVLMSDDRRVTAGTAQTGALAAQEVLTFTNWGVFGGITDVSARTVILAAGLTQSQVAAAINARASMSCRLRATTHEGKLVIIAPGRYTVTSNVAASANSTGLGTVPLREGGAGENAAHEVGHALWMRHATTKIGQNAVYPREHNRPEWQICNMSYINQGHFCGKCILKLRGCDETTLLSL